MIVTEETETGITMRGTLAGLPPAITAGFHIASGYSCVDEKAVGGKYYEGMVASPWFTMYVSDDHGAAQISSQSVKDFSLSSERPVLARAVVLEGQPVAIEAPAGILGCGASAPAALRLEAAALAPAAAAAAAAAATEKKAAQQQKLATGSGSKGGMADSPSPWLSSLGIGVFGTSLVYSLFMSYVWAIQHPHWAEHTMLDPHEWEGVDGGSHHNSHVGISSGLV